jgi:ribose-phosphate pyrophosphokinase
LNFFTKRAKKEGIMLNTGRVDNYGLTFTRQLLSDYLPDLGLSRYIAYDKIKTLTKKAAAAPPGSEQRDALAGQILQALKESFRDVKAVLHDMEIDAQANERKIRDMPVDDLRADDQLLTATYIHLHRIDRYRALNVMGFAKAMEKFLKRVATGSLELQDKIRRADSIVSSSILTVPMYATATAKEWVAATHSVVHGTTLEASFDALDRAVAANPIFAHRILPMSLARHFRERSLSQQLQGTFAAKVLAGTSSTTIAKHICAMMRSSAKIKADVGRFANGEVSLKINEAVRADDVYVVQSMASSNYVGARADSKHAGSGGMSAAIVELMLALQAAMLASCARLTAVIPYMAYSKRTSEIAALAEMLEVMGCQRVITVDLFAEQVEGMFNIPVDNVSARDEFVQYLLMQYKACGKPLTNLVVVSPNADNVSRARGFADRIMKLGKLNAKTELVGVASALTRTDADQVDVAGNVKGAECIIVDNVLDEAMTVCRVAEELIKLGATSVKLFATHGLFSGNAVQLVSRAPFDEIVMTDSINRDDLLRDAALARKLRILPVAPLLAGVIDCVHSDINAVSELLERS